MSTSQEIKSTDVELTDEYKNALTLFQQGSNLFITGSAGTGKTTLLRKIIDKCVESKKCVLQCGPTGVSALQLPNGNTLHSALKLPVGDFPSKEQLTSYYEKLLNRNKRMDPTISSADWFYNIKNASVIIIDEISMVSAWMLDAIDIALCGLKDCFINPMGGLQVIFVGDFYQLPPVYQKNKIEKSDKNPSSSSSSSKSLFKNNNNNDAPPEQGMMAFMSPVWSSLDIKQILLTKTFRQENEEFVRLLNTIRHGESFDKEMSKKFNQLLQDNPKPQTSDLLKPLFICYKRADVQTINATELKKLKQKQKNDNAENNDCHVYKFPFFKDRVTQQNEDDLKNMTKMVKETLNIAYAEKEIQEFCVGMRVMLVRNTVIEDTKLVNGDTGTIVDFDIPPSEIETSSQDGTTTRSISLSQFIVNSAHTRYSGMSPKFSEQKFPVVQFDRFPEDEFQILPVSWGKQDLNHQTGEFITRFRVDSVPLIPAWSITVHRTQGVTITDIQVHINADCMDFCPGAFYVSISRCKRFEQLTISNYKGFRQSQEAKKFYNGTIVLPPPKKYQQSIISKFLPFSSSSSSSTSSNNNDLIFGDDNTNSSKPTTQSITSIIPQNNNTKRKQCHESADENENN